MSSTALALAALYVGSCYALPARVRALERNDPEHVRRAMLARPCGAASAR